MKIFSWALIAAACLNAQEPVIYATWGSRQMKADLYRPAQGEGPFPAIVYVHGGGWRGGTRTQFARHAQRMAGLGYVGLCVEYRFAQEAKWPAAMDDVTAAVNWLRAYAAQYRIDVARLGAVGGSAGGHLAAMLGVRGQVKAVAAFNPAVDMIGLAGEALGSNAVSSFLGGSYQEKPAVWREASPIEHVSGRSARFLFLHGDADTTVPYAHTVRMHELLKKAGVHSELYTVAGAKHGFFNADPEFAPALERMVAFFRRQLE